MKSLKTLIRMHKRELDRIRREVAQLEATRDAYIDMVKRMQEELLREIATADELGEMRGFFGDFSEAIKKRQKEIAVKILKVEQQIQELQIEIQARFAELKKFEIAYERHLERVKKAKEKKEQLQLDEVGLRKFANNVE